MIAEPSAIPKRHGKFPKTGSDLHIPKILGMLLKQTDPEHIQWIIIA